MALTKCQDCGEPVSTNATACPRCGAVPPKAVNRNSSFTGLFIVLALIVGIFVYARIFIGEPDTPSVATSSDIAAQARERIEAAQMQKAKDFNAKKQTVLRELDIAIGAKKFDVAEVALQQWNGVHDDDLEKRKPAIQAGLRAQQPKKDAENAAKVAAARTADREYFAQKVETGFLKAGMNVSAKAVGNDKRTLDLDYPLANKVFMYQISHEGDFYDRVAAAGFQKIIVHGIGGTYTLPIDR